MTTRDPRSNKNNQRQAVDATSQAPYLVSISPWFMLLSVGVAVVGPFVMGRFARDWLITSQHLPPIVSSATLGHSSLPSPVLGTATKLPPSTRYTTKHYQAKGTGSESFLVRSNSPSKDSSSSSSKGSTVGISSTPSLTILPKANLKRPATTSESQIVDLLNELVATSSDTILSYHCHKQQQITSCVGIAHQGHIALHAFPQHLALAVYGIDLDIGTTQQIIGTPLTLLQGPRTTAAAAAAAAADSVPATTVPVQEQVSSAFVHPALFVHNQPELVVLVGGSSSSLEQILHHNTVGKVIALDCNATTPHHQDPRVLAVQSAAAEWLAMTTTTPTNKTPDLIFVESSRVNPLHVAASLTRMLKNDGLLVVQTEGTLHKFRWIQELTRNKEDYDVIKEYDVHGKNFLVAFANDSYLGQWFANEAEVNLKIHERVGPAFLDYFDGAMMQSYQYPSRIVEDVYCSHHEEDVFCQHGHGFDPSRTMIPITSFEVKLSTIQNAGRGVYLTHDAEEGAYIFVDGCVQNIYIPDTMYTIIEDFSEGEYTNVSLKNWETLMWYTSGYGFVHEEYGPQAHDVDPGIGTFVNHGCNGTTNVGSMEYVNLTEFSTSFAEPDERITYHPVFDRALRTNACRESIALRSIQRGEEIFNNYMTFENVAELGEYAESLRNECAGKAVGQVSEYEIAVQENQILQPHLRVNGSECFQCGGTMS